MTTRRQGSPPPFLRRIGRALAGRAFKHLPGMITCEAFDAFIVNYLDGSLPHQQRILFERHLRACPHCRSYLERYKMTVHLAAAAGPISSWDALGEPPEDLVHAILSSRRGG